jgi:mRNA interferase RelE/StbE
MTYKVVFTDEARKELKKLDKHIALFITAWVRKNLEGCAEPRKHGKGLTANRSGKWRYRVGDYRLIAEIQDEKVIILILTVGHRREVYEI